MNVFEIVNTLALLALLLLAVYQDLRQHRIANRLNLAGLVTAIALQALAHGWSGLTAGVLGLLVGAAAFMPFYLLRAMGAGDVKLLAVVGAFLGVKGAISAAIVSMLAGGAAGLGYVGWSASCAMFGMLRREGLAAAGGAAFAAAGIARRQRLPFALPIAIGGFTACWQQGGFRFLAG